MATKNLIHRKHLSLLRVYFRKIGWTLLNPKGPWEVFRANSLEHPKPVIVYRSFNEEHFTIQDRDAKIFREFMKWLKEGGCVEDDN